MKKLIGIFISLLIAVNVYAFPPTPLVSGLTNASNVAITGGNITGITNFSTANLTVSGAVNATGATWTGFNVGTGTVGNLSSTNANITGGNLTGIINGSFTDLTVSSVANVTRLEMGTTAAANAMVTIKGTANDSILVSLSPKGTESTGNSMEWYRATDSVKVGAINKNGGIYNGGWYIAKAPSSLFVAPTWASMMDLQSDLTTSSNVATLVVGSEPTGSYEANPLIAGLDYQLNNTFRLMPNGSIFINDNTNTTSVQGITVNQGGNDDNIITLKSSDVAQPTTEYEEVDTYMSIRKINSSDGGVLIRGLSDTGLTSGILFQGYLGASDPTDYIPAISFVARKNIRATVQALAATETILNIKNHSTEYLSILGDGKVNFWKTANDGTNYEGLQIDPATAGNMQIKYITGGSGTDDGDITLTPAGTGQLKNTASVITSGSGTGITVNHTGAVIQQVYKVTTTYTAYTDSDLTKGIVIATLPAKTRLVAAYADTTVAYAGTDITAATLEVGVTAEGAAEILAVHNVFAAPIVVGDLDADMGTAMTRAAKEQGAYMPSWTGTTAVYATIDATTGAATTLASLTAGSTTFYLLTEKLP